MIVAYRGYGTPHKLYLQGRVLENKGINAAADGDSTWDNLVNMVKRFTSAGIPHARVRACFQDIEREFVADKAGYFDVWIEPSQPLPDDSLWCEVTLELIEPHRKGSKPVQTTASVLVPPPDAQFAVISDIDDTVVHTDAVNLLRMAFIVFLGNARTRLPLKGVAGFYGRSFTAMVRRASILCSTYQIARGTYMICCAISSTCTTFPSARYCFYAAGGSPGWSGCPRAGASTN